jgi:hypothetical protein
MYNIYMNNGTIVNMWFVKFKLDNTFSFLDKYKNRERFLKPEVIGSIVLVKCVCVWDCEQELGYFDYNVALPIFFFKYTIISVEMKMSLKTRNVNDEFEILCLSSTLS